MYPNAIPPRTAYVKLMSACHELGFKDDLTKQKPKQQITKTYHRHQDKTQADDKDKAINDVHKS